jgi:uncharacterized Zn-finger protein
MQNVCWSCRYEISCCGLARGEYKIANLTEKRGVNTVVIALLKSYSGEHPFSSDVCNKSFTHHSTLKAHQRIHRGEHLFACDMCNKLFAQKYILKRHLVLHCRYHP